MSKNNLYTHNGVSYQHVGKGKWQFTVTKKDGKEFTKFERVGGHENAKLVATAIAASVKRNFAGFDGVDNMAAGQIAKLIKPIAPATYNGISFSFGAPQQHEFKVRSGSVVRAN